MTGPSALPDLSGPAYAIDHPRRAFVEPVMGLPVSVHVRGPRARGPEVEAAALAMFAALRADDATFSTWKPDSPVSRIRRGELRLEDAGPRVAEVAALCEEATARTGGAFSAWLPGPDGQPAFDPTGLVKGWAVEQAFDALVDRLATIGAGEGGHDALVSAGGDVAVACARTDTPDWMVGIEDPRDRSRTLLMVPLRRGAVATSGTAARGEHIVDPATGAAPTGLLSATVIGPSLTWADVYATAAFVRGPDAAAWLGTLPDHDDLAGVLVDTAGEVTTVGPAT
ncbi:MAG: FAD:protein FMN transferase [Lapillicoccus sp.]